MWLRSIKMKKICPQCGKEFETNNKKKKYCCDRCRINHRKDVKQKIKKKKCVCLNCGKEIVVQNNYKKLPSFCSKKCYDEYSLTHNEIATCVVCGAPFVPVNSRHVCCSRKCRDAYTIYKRGTKCKHCGKIFHTFSNKIYCSDKCKKEHEKFNAQICEECGKEFYPKNSTSKYCSLEC